MRKHARPARVEVRLTYHVNPMLPKIGARDRTQAVGYAYRRGLAPR